MSLIAEILRDSRGRHGTLDTHERRLIRRSYDDNGAFHAFRPKIALDEVAHLTATLAHQCDDTDVSLRVAGDHREQRGLAHAGTGHDADTLSLAHRDQAIDGPHANVEALVDARPLQRVRWRCLQRILPLAENRPLVVHGIAEAIEHASQELRPHLDLQRLLRGDHFAARADALHLADRHEHDIALAKTHDFCRERRYAGEMRTHVAELADADRRSLRLDDETDDLRHLARELHGLTGRDGILKLLGIDRKCFTHDMTSCTAFLISSSCVARRASTLPFGVSMMQSPGCNVSSAANSSLASVPVSRLWNSSRASSTMS